LDTVDRFGIKVVITHFLGTTDQTPIWTPENRQGAIDAFVDVVRKYSNHPAVLAFTFGNEMNGAWNGFLTGFGNMNNCGWNPAPFPDGCLYPQGGSGPCYPARTCTYKAFLSWVNDAGKQAKAVMGNNPKLILTSFADVDWVDQIIKEFDGIMTDLDAWGVQLYRGDNFGYGDNDFLEKFPSFSSRPLIVTEYGVDAYKDPCGVCDGNYCPTPCYNGMWSAPAGFGEDPITHADWNGKLTQNIKDHWDKGTVGGCIMSWNDEYWKTSLSVKGCQVTLGDTAHTFNPANCDWKGNVYCPNNNVTEHALCGYWLSSTFDHYVNEAWYGINRVIVNPAGGYLDILSQRELYFRLQQMWFSPNPAPLPLATA